VIAPALVPRKPGERIKTDRRDARKLAELHRAGLLTAVRPPTPAEEAVRDPLTDLRPGTRCAVGRAHQSLHVGARVLPVAAESAR
jgi:transposase